MQADAQPLKVGVRSQTSLVGYNALVHMRALWQLCIQRKCNNSWPTKQRWCRLASARYHVPPAGVQRSKVRLVKAQQLAVRGDIPRSAER